MISFQQIYQTGLNNIPQQLRHLFYMARTCLPVQSVFGTDSPRFYRIKQNILCLTYHCILLTILSCITNFIYRLQYKYHLGQICFLRMLYHKRQLVFCFWRKQMYGSISTYVSTLRTRSVYIRNDLSVTQTIETDIQAEKEHIR